MKRFLLTLLLVAVFAPLLGGGSCASAGGEKLPTLPQTVTKVVEVDRDYPSWATEPLPVPAPINGTLGALDTSHSQRGDVIRFGNCIRALLRQLGRGEDVDPNRCGTTPGTAP